MKFMENWKRFWTLNRHHAAGFTLVELIVVIAILAILAGVAVPAYSGYVAQANKQADLSLISEIEQALTLAGYNGKLTSGYVVLSQNGVEEVSSTAVGDALTAAFGAGWETSDALKLKHTEWGNNGLTNDLSPYFANSVVNSSYLTGNRQNVLLNDVEEMTSMVTDLLPAMTGTVGNLNFTNLFTPDGGTCAIDETATRYGITKADGETWEEWGNKPGNETAYSNLLVLTAADEYDKYMGSFFDPNGYQVSGASTLIYDFSLYYGFASQNSEFSTVLDGYMDDLSNVSRPEDGVEWWNRLQSEVTGAGEFAQAYETYSTGQANTDGEAFLSILAGLGNPSEEQAAKIAADISNPNLFTEGTVNGMYNDYVTAAGSMAGIFDQNSTDDTNFLSIDISEGEVAILFNGAKSMNTITTD